MHSFGSKFFSKNFKSFANNKNSFKMFNTAINSHKFLINFSNKSYFYKVSSMINSITTIKTIPMLRLVENNSSELDTDESINAISPLGNGSLYLNYLILSRYGKYLFKLDRESMEHLGTLKSISVRDAERNSN